MKYSVSKTSVSRTHLFSPMLWVDIIILTATSKTFLAAAVACIPSIFSETTSALSDLSESKVLQRRKIIFEKNSGTKHGTTTSYMFFWHLEGFEAIHLHLSLWRLDFFVWAKCLKRRRLMPNNISWAVYFPAEFTGVNHHRYWDHGQVDQWLAASNANKQFEWVNAYQMLFLNPLPGKSSGHVSECP